MPSKTYTDAERQAAVALARLTNPDQAAATLQVDPRTLRSWVAKAPPPDDADAWKATQSLAQQQLLTSLASGKVKHPSILATVAGIAARNVRYATLIARRLGGQGAEPEPEPDPLKDALHALRDDQQRLVRDELLCAEWASRDRDGAEQLTDPDPDHRDLLAWIATVAAMSEDQVEQRSQELEAELSRLQQDWNERGRLELESGPLIREAETLLARLEASDAA